MNRPLFVSNAFTGMPIGLKPTERDGVLDVMFCAFRVGTVDMTNKAQGDP